MRSSNSRRRAGLGTLLLAAALVVPALAAVALPPSEGLDPTYGTSGLATVGYSRVAGTEIRHLDANVSAKDPEGGVVVAGVDTQGPMQVVSIARFTLDGAPDPAFSGDGKMSFDTFPESNNIPSYQGVCDVLVQPNGAILLSVLAPSSPTSDAVLYRFTAAGARDTSFSGDGKMRIDWGQEEGCAQIALRPDGRIVAATAYTIGMSFEYSVGLAQVMPDGKMDMSFDGDGKRLISLSNAQLIAPGEIFDIAVQAGKIVVASSGAYRETGQLDGLLARFTPAGALDKTFSGNGWLLRSGTARMRDVEVAGDKLIVLAEDLDSNYVESVVVGRLTNAGSWDTSFSGDGLARRPAPSAPVAIAVQPGGSVVVAGYDTGGTPGSMLWRYDSSGVPDGDFGGNGTAELSHCESYETAAACFEPVGVHAAANGKVVVAGGARNCPGLSCPTDDPLEIPRRFAAVRVIADPLVAVYAEPSLRDPYGPAESEDAGTARVAVKLTSKSVTPVTVSYETKPGTATAADYTHTVGSVTFEPGQVTKMVHVPLNNDGIYEGAATYQEYEQSYQGTGDEHFTFRLLPATASGATVPIRETRIGIDDDETPPEIQFPPVPADDPNGWVNVVEGAAPLQLPIRLSHPVKRAFWVDVRHYVEPPHSSLALPGEDYVAINERVTFAPGEVTATYGVTLIDDDVEEYAETFSIEPYATSMEYPAGFMAWGRIAIYDDDAP